MLWTREEENVIIDYYADKGVNYCSELLPNRTISSIVNKAKRLNIYVTDPVIRRTKIHSTYEDQLIERDIQYFPTETYINSRTPITHECLNGHEWKVSPNKVLGRKANCPKCSAINFNPSKPCILYLAKFDNYYRLGITTRTMGTDWAKLNMTLEWSIFYETGMEAYIAKQKALEYYSADLVDTGLLHSGNSETLSVYISKEFFK